MNCCGTSFGHAASTFAQTACADATEICCPTTERASVTNGSPRLSRCTGPNFGISFFRMRSRLTRSAHALSQYAGRVTSGVRPPICTGTASSAASAASPPALDDARVLRTTSPSCPSFVTRASSCTSPASSAGNAPLLFAREVLARVEAGACADAPFSARLTAAFFAAPVVAAARTPVFGRRPGGFRRCILYRAAARTSRRSCRLCRGCRVCLRRGSFSRRLRGRCHPASCLASRSEGSTRCAHTRRHSVNPPGLSSSATPASSNSARIRSAAA